MPWDFMFKSFSYVQLARLLRILRLIRFTKIASFQITNPFVVLTKLSIYMLFIGHWVGCLWWQIGKDGRDNGFGPTAVVVNSDDLGLQLPHSLYWGMQALTGLGSNLKPLEKEECGLCIFICLAGSFMLSYILGEVFHVIQVINSTSVRYSHVMHELDEFIDVNKVEPETAARMRRWQSAHSERTHGIDQEMVLARLPRFTRQDLARQQVGTFLGKSALFSLMPPALHETILTYLKPRVFAAGDVLIKQDDIGEEMFFIERGEIEV